MLSYGVGNHIDLRGLPGGAEGIRTSDLRERETAAANLRYLEEHGLCKSGVKFGARDDISFNPSTITAAGLDFLEDDGGLSAILGVVTVKLHADTIRELISAKIETSSMPAEEKSKPRKVLAGLSEAGLRAATTDLVKSGLDHLPDAAHWLHSSWPARLTAAKKYCGLGDYAPKA